MFKKFLAFICLLVACKAADDEKRPAGLTTYDQRQTGKYNVHVNIKDVQFFSLSDSLAGIGGDYGDYGDYETMDGPDSDYDASHLTVNPILAFLGQRPTTKPTTTTEKVQTSPATSPNSIEEATTEKASTTTIKQSSESEIKDSAVVMIKPAPAEDKKPLEAIDYEEIPVEVQYYRANHQKLPSNGRHAAINRFHKRPPPSVQIIDGHGRAGNVKIMESEQPTVKICSRGEYRDAMGRCRVRARRGVPGL